MMPGQEPYTMLELGQLYRAISDAAEGDPGEEHEAAALALFREAQERKVEMPWCHACQSYHAATNPTCYLKQGFPDRMDAAEIERRRAQCESMVFTTCHDCKAVGHWGPLGRCQPCYIRLMDDYKDKLST